MKFGDTLRDRSIPQWAYHNVDYDDLKQAIKAHTTGSGGQPVSIPGQGGEAKALKEFEDGLYGQLLKEHTRVDQFVRSKAGELTRRLAHLDTVLAHLNQRYPPSGDARKSVRRLEKYSKLEDITLQAGQELEYLDRFVSVNCQAFRKILKKYKKWTNSSGLEQRFYEHVLSRPTSFANRNFLAALAHYNEILAAVRAASLPSGPIQALKPRSALHDQKSARSKTTSPSSAADIQFAYENGSEVELDTALAILPQGQVAGRACYWVHVDNLLQIQVLLLRYMRSRKNQICTSAPNPSSSRASRQGSINGSGPIPVPQSSHKAGMIVCDELQRFAKRRSSTPISESENDAGRALKEPAASIRYSSSGEAVLTVGTSSNETPKAKLGSPWRTARLKRKALGSLFDSDTSRGDPSVSEDPDSRLSQSPAMNGALRAMAESDRIQSCLHTMPSVTDAKSWLQKHQDVQPLVEIHSDRTRFAGIRNTDTSGIWATLDTEIVLAKCSSALLAEQYNSSSSSEEATSPCLRFPHAVLNVRFEGDVNMGLIKTLDGSHLTERVRGFSLDTHAVATLYKPHRIPPPYWLPLLDQDIRKVPDEAESSSQLVSSARMTPRSGSPRPNSNSATSTNDGPTGSGFSARLESSETSVPETVEPPSTATRKKRKLRRESLRRESQDASQRENIRYWNEFDDGDEGTENNAYTIFIDPNASSSFPGAATISHITKASINRVKSLFRRQKTPDLERQPLLGDHASVTRSNSEDSDLEDGAASPPYRTHSHQGLPSHPRRKPLFSPRNTRETWLTGACVASFILSLVLLFMETILINTSRRKAVAATDVGVLVGVAFSLALGIGGLGATAARAERVGWVWWTVVVLLFAVVVAGNGLLLTIVL